jgi:ABC-type multidrug transport system ATPase subunit
MEGRTTLIIAHRLSTISLADRVVLLDQHRIVADGTHAELLETTPLYGEVLAQAVDDLEPDVEDELAATSGTSPASGTGHANGNGNGNGNGKGNDAGRPDRVGSGRSTGRDL